MMFLQYQFSGRKTFGSSDFVLKGKVAQFPKWPLDGTTQGPKPQGL